MRKVTLKAIILAFFFFSTASTALPPGYQTISFSGKIEVPIVLESNTYWIDDGPLFVASKSPLITYRVIDEAELDFKEPNQSVHEFFKSSFSSPTGIAEKAFYESHKDYLAEHKSEDNVDFFILKKHDESKAYVVSSEIGFAIEISVFGEQSSSILMNIIDGVNLKKGN